MYMEQFEDKPTLEQIKNEYSEIVSLFPALHKYKISHNTDNLKKLCVEIADFAVQSIHLRKMSKKDKFILICLTS